MNVKEMDKMLKHVWNEPKAQLGFELPSPLLMALNKEPYEEIDPDWWEPRYDAPWRRQYARDREAYGGASVAAAKPPLEGPNNPAHVKRELEYAEQNLAEAKERSFEADVEKVDARLAVAELKTRLENL